MAPPSRNLQHLPGVNQIRILQPIGSRNLLKLHAHLPCNSPQGIPLLHRNLPLPLRIPSVLPIRPGGRHPPETPLVVRQHLVQVDATRLEGAVGALACGVERVVSAAGGGVEADVARGGGEVPCVGDAVRGEAAVGGFFLVGRGRGGVPVVLPGGDAVLELVACEGAADDAEDRWEGLVLVGWDWRGDGRGGEGGNGERTAEFAVVGFTAEGVAAYSAGKTAADGAHHAALAIGAVGLVSLLRILLGVVLLAMLRVLLWGILLWGILLAIWRASRCGVVGSCLSLSGLRVRVVAAVLTHDGRLVWCVEAVRVPVVPG